MESKKILVSLVAILAVAFVIANVSALGQITSVKVNDVELVGVNKAPTISVFAGETLPVRVRFEGDSDSSDARIKIWISGARDYSVSSDRFKVLNGGIYSKLFAAQVPSDIDPSEDLTLNVLVESENGGSPVLVTVSLSAQRESYIVDILDVNVESKAQAGSNLPLGIVLKNRGIEFAEDTFVKVAIPALGVEAKSYFGDLSPVDQSDPDKEDAVERKMLLSIPSDAKPGVYLVQIEAYNGDSTTTLTKKVAITGASASSMAISSMNSKTFMAGEKGTYSLTLVNTGNKIQVYELSVESSNDDLSIDVDQPVVAVPAGSSETVKIQASSAKEGKYTFAVNVMSGEDLVKTETYVANVQGSGSKAFTGNTAVVVTVVLAIIFIVLLIVLIVLLTRKPEKASEIGESYY